MENVKKLIDLEIINEKTIAEVLNGREYGEELSEKERFFLKTEGFIVVTGRSDDLVELDGVIFDEYGCYGGRKFSFNRYGLTPYNKEPGYLNAQRGIDGYPWFFSTDYPHETFDILEGDDKYCRGLVVKFENLKNVLC